MAITVRDIAVDDLPALMSLWEEIQAENAGLDVSVLLGRIEMAESQNIRLLAAFEGEQAVGIAMVAMSDVGTWAELPAVQVSGLHVLSKARRRGVAKALLNAALVCADNWGCNNLVVTVPPASREANRFFARLGFAPIATKRIVDTAAIRRMISAEPKGLSAARLRRRLRETGLS